MVFSIKDMHVAAFLNCLYIKLLRKGVFAMKGRNMYKRLSYDEQAELLCKVLRKEIDQLNTLPREEAKKVAHSNLIEIGFLTKDGKVAKPYLATNN